MGMAGKLINMKAAITKDVDRYKYHVASMTLLFEVIKMINGHHKYIDRETFNKEYAVSTRDIETESYPLDIFIPDLENERTFMINRDVPEYQEMIKRVTERDFLIAFEDQPTNEVLMKYKEDHSIFPDIQDDVFIYFIISKYLDKLDQMRLISFSITRELIEWTVNNITLDDWKSFIGKKISDEKYMKYGSDYFFTPELARMQAFYNSEEQCGEAEFDVNELLRRLATSVNTATESFMLLAIYQILSYAIPDIIGKDNVEESPCRDYVVNVISKII